MPYAYVVGPGSKLSLKEHDPARTDGLEKDEAKDRTKEIAKEVEELQELMYAAGTTGVLCVFQGADTAGKDGAINRLLEYVNVQSTRVESFKVPTKEELAHDFLWRVHAKAPGRGDIAVFNRSHYEDVLVVRVNALAPKEVWQARYEQINEFESLLAANGTVVLKFFLHISKEEQAERLVEREQDPVKAWKLSIGDWVEREKWDLYEEAFEAALTRCSTETAPWRIVPSNKKWFRDLCVAEAVADALRPFRSQWMAKLEEIGREAKAELAEYRKART